MTTAELKMATDIVRYELGFRWSDETLANMDGEVGVLAWCENFSFHDCRALMYPSSLVDVVAKMLDYGLVFPDIVNVIARAAWLRRQEIMKEKKEAEA